MKPYNLILRSSCPACECSGPNHYMAVPDHRYSKMNFGLVSCVACGLVYTQRVPVFEDVGDFYKAESYDSHVLDNKSLISRIYRLVRKWNINKKIKLVKRLNKKGLVVDYGCGLGHLVKEMQSRGLQVKGYEIDEDVRGLSKSVLDLETESLEAFRLLDDNSVSVLMMWHVLEHVYDLRRDFQHIVNKVEDNGLFLIALPNLRSFDAKFYKSDWEAFDVPRHLYHFDKESIKDFCSSYGLNLESIIPMRFDSYYVSMRSEVNKNRGFVPRGVLIGWWSNIMGRKYGYSSHIYIFKKKPL